MDRLELGHHGFCLLMIPDLEHIGLQNCWLDARHVQANLRLAIIGQYAKKLVVFLDPRLVRNTEKHTVCRSNPEHPRMASIGLLSALLAWIQALICHKLAMVVDPQGLDFV